MMLGASARAVRRLDLRVVLAALLVTASLAGCVDGSTLPPPADGAPLPTLACPDPCATVIDRGTRWEPTVTVDPRDPARIVAASMDQGFDASGQRFSWPLAHLSEDGGATWTTMRMPMGPDQPPSHPLFAHNQADDPAVVFLADGTLLYTALTFTFASGANRGLGGTGASLTLWRSTDGGRTYSDGEVLHEGSGAFSLLAAPGFVGHDKQWLAAAPDGSVLMAWNVNERGTARCTGTCTRVLATASTDGGRSWSDASIVYDGVASGAFPVVMADGSWVVSYRETSDAAVHVAVSTDDGGTWSTNTTIDSTTKFPVLAKTTVPGASRERIYMAYPMSAEGDPQPDVPQVITLRWSDDGGHSWSDAISIDATRVGARTSPALAATPAGGAIVTYWRPHEEGGSLGAELRAVSISAAGEVSRPLTLDAHEGPTSTTGDYMGLVALPNAEGAFAVWNARHGDAHVITGARLTSG